MAQKERKWRVHSGDMKAIVMAFNPQEAFVRAVKKKNPKALSALAWVVPVSKDQPPVYIDTRPLLQEAGLMEG